jgi:amino acid transporter
VSLVLIWLTGSDYNTLLTIASEMILVPYFLVGAFFAENCGRPLHKRWYRRLHLWLMVIICVGTCAFAVVSDTLRSGSSGLFVRPSYAPARSFAQTPRIGANWFIAGCRCTGNVDAGGVSGRPAAELKGDTHG